MEWTVQKWEIKSKANFLKLSKQLDVRNRLWWIKRAHGLAELLRWWVTALHWRDTMPCTLPLQKCQGKGLLRNVRLGALACRKSLCGAGWGFGSVLIWSNSLNSFHGWSPSQIMTLLAEEGIWLLSVDVGDSTGSLAWLPKLFSLGAGIWEPDSWLQWQRQIIKHHDSLKHLFLSELIRLFPQDNILLM